MFQPALNITDQIADCLAKQIIHGELVGGDRIQEIKLAKSMEVSRGSIREALLILQRRHLIEVVPRKGAVVNHLELAEALELIDLLAALEIRWLKQLAMSAGRGGVADALSLAVAEMDQAAKVASVDAALDARMRFYAIALEHSSRYVRALFESLLPTSQRLLATLIKRTGLDIYDLPRFYRALVEALGAGDDARVTELVSAFGRRVCALTQQELGDGNRRHWSRSTESGSETAKLIG